MGLGPQFEQLSMFMTPRQIMEDYAPLEGDRKLVNVSDGGDLRQEHDEEVWKRKTAEAHLPKTEYHEARGEERAGTFTSFMSKLHGDKLTGGPGPEPEWNTGHTATFEENQGNWELARDEFVDDNIDMYSSNRDNTSLVDSIRESGVQMPVRVGPTQVTGGHHRIAAAHSINPDMLIPVLHETEDRVNRRSQAYPYT